VQRREHKRAEDHRIVRVGRALDDVFFNSWNGGSVPWRRSGEERSLSRSTFFHRLPVVAASHADQGSVVRAVRLALFVGAQFVRQPSHRGIRKHLLRGRPTTTICRPRAATPRFRRRRLQSPSDEHGNNRERFPVRPMRQLNKSNIISFSQCRTHSHNTAYILNTTPLHAS